MSVLSDHHNVMIRDQRNDVNPVPRFDHIEIMLDPGSRRHSGICPYGKDTIRIIGSGLDARPRFDHVLSPFRIKNLILFGAIPFVKPNPFRGWMTPLAKNLDAFLNECYLIDILENLCVLPYTIGNRS
jgi:hypothetical protein